MNIFTFTPELCSSAKSQPVSGLMPKFEQRGSHMLTMGVDKPTKIKHVSLDTKFSDEYDSLEYANYNFTFPDRISDVKSMTVTNVEIPVSWYNISAAFGNNTFRILNVTDVSNVVVSVVIIPDGQYTVDVLTTTINGLLPSGVSFETNENKLSVFSVTDGLSNFYIEFFTDSKGENNVNQPKFRLGWLLGFRSLAYPIRVDIGADGFIVSESPINLNGPRYLYLMIDEFQNGKPNSFVSVLSASFMKKNIMARISLSNLKFPYGSVCVANYTNGFLTSDKRIFDKGCDIQRLNIQLVNENGEIVKTNGTNMTICFVFEYT